MINEFEKMEREIVTAIFKKEYPELVEFWQKIYFVKSREFTGSGFFSNYSTYDIGSNELKRMSIPSENRTVSTTVSVTVNNKIFVGFVLFLKNGRLDCLEGYTFGDEPWPESIESYEIYV